MSYNVILYTFEKKNILIVIKIEYEKFGTQFN